MLRLPTPSTRAGLYPLLRRMHAHGCRPAVFWCDKVAASAVEFALLLPLILAIFVGMSEMAHAIDNWRKVTLTARTVADLTSQGDKQNPISSSTMNDILASATAVMRPFDASGVKIVVSALAVDTSASTVHPKVCSSVATSNATARSTGVASALTIPPGFQANGYRYVLAEVSTPYTPMLGGSLVRLVGGVNGQLNFTVSLPWPTRRGRTYGTNTYPEVVLPGGAQCP